MLLPNACPAGDSPWSTTLYGGAASNEFASQIFLHGQFKPDGAMIGAAGDLRLATLGWGITFDAENQVTQYFLGHEYTSFALGIGFRFNHFPWTDRLPTSLAIYTGPSYASDPPARGIIEGNTPAAFAQKRLLNYVGIEIAVATARSSPWDICFRAYHRSGAWGLYSEYADEGTTLGLGIRRRF